MFYKEVNRECIGGMVKIKKIGVAFRLKTRGTKRMMNVCPNWNK